MMRWFSSLAIVSCAGFALAQQPAPPLPSPNLTTMAPLGLQAGQTAEIVLTGSDLNGVNSVSFADPRLTGRVVKVTPPTVAITSDKALSPGLYDIRLASPRGITNALPLVIGSRPEITEAEPNDDVPQAQKIKLGTTINGTIGKPTDVDYVSFVGVTGQTIRIDCATASIGTRAKPLLELIAPNGRRWLSGPPKLNTDAAIEAKLPEPGTYLLRLCEFAYQTGGPEHGYRLTIDERPMERLTRRSPVNALVDQNAPQDGIQETDQPNDSPETAQRLAIPMVLNGRIERSNDIDWYRFSALKSQPLMIELLAERIGSPIDAYLSIRDAKSGKEIVGEDRLDDDAESLHPIAFASRSLDPTPYRFEPPADGDYLVRVATRDGRSTFGPSAQYRLRISPPKPRFLAFAMPRSREQPAGVTLRPGIETAVDLYVHRIDGFEGPVTVSCEDVPSGVTVTSAVIGTNQKWGVATLKTTARPLPIAFTKSRPIIKSIAAESIFDLQWKASAMIDGGESIVDVEPATIAQGIPANANVPAATRLDQAMPVAVRNLPTMPGYLLSADMANTKGKDGKPASMPLAMKPGEKVTIPIKVFWTGRDRPPINLTMEPTHADNQRSPFSGNNANTQVVIAKEKSEGVITLELRPNAVPGRYRATIRGDAIVAVRIDGKSSNVTVSAWTTIDVTITK